MPYDEPFISVVTPFRNTASYLAECIDSVLSQNYGNYEYILSDNGSTDGSTEIAEEYARRDARIRFIRQAQPLGHIGHYNRALSEISNASQYCKMVQADDFIFAGCLQLMVKAFAQSETIGLVSSYDVTANMVSGSGFPYPASMVPGREVAKLYLRKNVFVFGSPTTVMYRSSIVVAKLPFFVEHLLHPDSEKCLEILESWDFGFVHQVLSFRRTGNVNESISESVRDFNPYELHTYINVQRYAARFLEQREAEGLKRHAKRQYYSGLAQQALRLRGSAFWKYQKRGLNTLGESLDRAYLAVRTGGVLLEMFANPGATMLRAFRVAKRWISKARTMIDHRSMSTARPSSQRMSTRLSDGVNPDR